MQRITAVLLSTVIIVLAVVLFEAIAQLGATERARIDADTQRAIAVVFAGKTTAASVTFQTATTNSRREELPVSSPALTKLSEVVSVPSAGRRAPIGGTGRTE